jgi:hypothetical protein
MKNNNKKLRIDFFTATIAFILSYVICSHANEKQYNNIILIEQQTSENQRV